MRVSVPTADSTNVPQQKWAIFGRADTRHAFGWTRAAPREPLAPGSASVAMPSGTAPHPVS